MKPIWDRLHFEVLLMQFVSWLPSFVSAIVILVGFWVLYRVTSPALRRIFTRARLEAAFVDMLIGVYRFTVMTFGVVMSLSQLGINVGAALAGLGVAGLTIGFAAKDSLSNLMAGFLIFWDKPFNVGDWVTLGNYYGEVAEITMRTTRVRTLQNTWVFIPNQTVINTVLVNHSAHGRTRVDVPVGISYAQDIEKARKVLIDVAAHLSFALAEPEPKVAVNNLGASTVDLLVMVWIANAKDEKATKVELLEKIKNGLDAAGIEMPSPQLDLTVRSLSAKVWEHVGEMVSAGAANGRNGNAN